MSSDKDISKRKNDSIPKDYGFDKAFNIFDEINILSINLRILI